MVAAALQHRQASMCSQFRVTTTAPPRKPHACHSPRSSHAMPFHACQAMRKQHATHAVRKNIDHLFNRPTGSCSSQLSESIVKVMPHSRRPLPRCAAGVGAVVFAVRVCLCLLVLLGGLFGVLPCSSHFPYFHVRIFVTWGLARPDGRSAW